VSKVATSRPEPSYATVRAVLPGVAMIAVTFGLARYGYGLLLPEMQADLRIDAHAAGLIASGAYLSYLAANLAVIWLTIHWGPRAAVGLAAGLAAAGMGLVASAGTAPWLAAGVLIAGAAAGLAFPPYADIVATAVHPDRRALAWSTISSGTGWGVAIAGPIAIVAADRWRVAWLVFVGLAVAAGILATLWAPARAATRPRLPQLSWTWFVCPKSRPLLLSSVLVGAGSSVWWTFSVEAIRTAGVSPAAAKIVYAVGGMATIAASLTGAAVDRIGLRAGYLVSCVPLAGSVGILGTGTRQLPVILAAAAMFGAFYGSVIATQGVWSAGVFAQRPSAGIAAVNTALTLGTIVGPAAAGAAIHRAGFAVTLAAASAAILLALPFCPPGRRRRRILAAHRCRAAPIRD
jgi:predicted MFS family arabinose efflux permease